MTSEKKRKYGKILNTGVNSTSIEKVLAFVRDSVSRGYKFWISTPNPEIILAAQKDRELSLALEKSDLAIPDGVGLAFAARFLRLGEIKIIKGRKLFMEMVKFASKKGWKVFILGGEPGVARQAGLNLRKTFRGVRIAYFVGPLLNLKGEPVTEAEREVERAAIAQINQFRPQILFVAFGTSKQEKWTERNLPSLKVGGAMVIGGTIDYVAGVVPLPPKWAEGSFEWLWRLITQPTRFGRLSRIFKATVIFPLKVFWGKLRSTQAGL